MKPYRISARTTLVILVVAAGLITMENVQGAGPFIIGFDGVLDTKGINAY